MLGGLNTIADRGPGIPPSTYKGHYIRTGHPGIQDVEKLAPMNPDNMNNQTHKNRFQYQQPTTVTGSPTQRNNMTYVKGVDFNSQ